MKYTPLNVGRNQIRLIRLKPRYYQHPRRSPRRVSNVAVFCELEHAFRGDDISYTALSYAWGQENHPRPISVGETILNVSVNLEEALREVRDERNDVMLWVDQICINQEDEIERGHQVQQMKQIYAEATCVIAWVGPAAHNSDLVLAQLNSIGEEAHDETGALDKKSFEDMIDHTFANVLPALADARNLESVSAAFHHFCKRSYWRRL